MFGIESHQDSAKMQIYTRLRDKNSIQDAPLALCEGTSVADSDFLAADHVRRNYCTETLMLLHRPGFRWHYLSNQNEHECFLFKIFDSLIGVQAKCRPKCPDSKYVRALDFLQVALTRPSDIAAFLLVVLQGKALSPERWYSRMLERSRERVAITRESTCSPCGS